MCSEGRFVLASTRRLHLPMAFLLRVLRVSHGRRQKAHVCLLVSLLTQLPVFNHEGSTLMTSLVHSSSRGPTSKHGSWIKFPSF